MYSHVSSLSNANDQPDILEFNSLSHFCLESNLSKKIPEPPDLPEFSQKSSILNKEKHKTIENTITTDLSTFMLDMYGNSLVPRSFALFVITYLKKLMTEIFGGLKHFIKDKNLECHYCQSYLVFT